MADKKNAGQCKYASRGVVKEPVRTYKKQKWLGARAAQNKISRIKDQDSAEAKTVRYT
jgi:hypothetical protein